MVALNVTANCHTAQAHGVAAIEAEREAFAAEAVEPVERTARALQAPVLSSIPSDGNER